MNRLKCKQSGENLVNSCTKSRFADFNFAKFDIFSFFEVFNYFLSRNWGGVQTSQADGSFFKLIDRNPQIPLIALLKTIIKTNKSQDHLEYMNRISKVKVKFENPCHGVQNASFASLRSLQHLALHLISSTRGVDTVLCGAQKDINKMSK